MEIKVVFLIIGVIYWVLKSLYSKKDASSPATPKKHQSPRPVQSSSSQKSVEDIFNEFVREVQNKNNPKPKVQPIQPKVKKKETMDWQEVSKSKIEPKKQLIKHEDYHAEHGKIEDIKPIDEIAHSEGHVYEFDKNNIDWKQAIITKEILDRKYA